MSQSITVKGIYKNNKTNSVGLHNPKNNRVANESELTHLETMYNKHILSNWGKFKTIEIKAYLQSGAVINCNNILQAIDFIKTDIL